MPSRRARIRRWFLCLSLSLVGLASLGCDDTALREKRQEFARIADAVEQVRRADNRNKHTPLEALKAVGCKHLCDYQKLCQRAYETHVAGLSALDRARLLSSGNDVAPAASALAKSEQLVTEARRLTTACAALEGETARSLKKQ